MPPISNFEGVFDGNGKTIGGLSTTGSKNLQGLFGSTRKGAVIRDLHIEVGSAGIRGKDNVGALVGRAQKTTITNVSVSVPAGGISGRDSVGALAGRAQNTTITNSGAEIPGNGVAGRRYVGGLAGRAQSCTIVGSYAYGGSGLAEVYENGRPHPEDEGAIAVRGSHLSNTFAGGLVGELSKSMVRQSASYVNVAGYNGSGGLAGRINASRVTDSYSRGHVLGLTVNAKNMRGERIGGFIGANAGTSYVENCYSAGRVESGGIRRIGPFAGLVGGSLRVTCVSVGNPHCVIFCAHADDAEVGRLGPVIENAEIFPDRANVEFVEAVDGRTLRVRTWERGSGETLACGTGACAAAVAATLTGRCQRGEEIRVILLGGDVTILYYQDGSVTLTGSAEQVFEGVVEI